MIAVKKEITMIEVNADKWSYNQRVIVNIDKTMLEEAATGKMQIKLTASQATQFANALKAQRKRIKK